jgi:triosephosphate isomerase
MNGSRSAIADLLGEVRSSVPAGADAIDVAVCCPFPYLADVAEALEGSNVAWGAQDCSAHEFGPYTGEVSAAMLAEFGCRYVIIGHSERRSAWSEADAVVAEKASRALAHGLTPIVCVGESLAARESGETDAVVKRQLSAVIHRLGACVAQIVVAYEPIWAIGTGQAARPEHAQAVHAVLRAQLHAAFRAHSGLKDGAHLRLGTAIMPGGADLQGAMHLFREVTNGDSGHDGALQGMTSTLSK